jgi:hypothetical protein
MRMGKLSVRRLRPFDVCFSFPLSIITSLAFSCHTRFVATQIGFVREMSVARLAR